MVTSYIALFWKMYDFSCDIATHCSCTPCWMWLNHWLVGGKMYSPTGWWWFLEIVGCLHFFVFLCNFLLTTQEVKPEKVAHFHLQSKRWVYVFQTFALKANCLHFQFGSDFLQFHYSSDSSCTVFADKNITSIQSKTTAICYEPKQPTLFSGNRWLPVL